MRYSNSWSYCFKEGEYIKFRLLAADDSIEELTRLLNRAYKSLADKGMNYVAATQDAKVTLRRVSSAYKCFVGIYEGKLVSTLSLYGPTFSDKCKWYSQPFVSKIGQFAVLPELQKYGIGHQMMDIAEEEAKQIENVTEVALDTAETADHLIRFYKGRGYRYIETIEWGITNYKSVILSKAIDL